jgi:hypothetical protein
MGILNAIFAPFIVLYLLMYSFFRYFEVSRFHPYDFDLSTNLHRRNTTRTPLLLEAGVIPPLLCGSSESLMSFLISLLGG